MELFSFEIEKVQEISYQVAWWLHRSTDVRSSYRSLTTDNISEIEHSLARI